MGRRGEIVTTVIVNIALGLFVAGCVEDIVGLVDVSTKSYAAACFVLLMATYLEVYAHRD